MAVTPPDSPGTHPHSGGAPPRARRASAMALALAATAASLLLPAAGAPAHAGPPPSPAADPLALKIVVAADGPVRVNGADLAGAGWDLERVDPAALALTAAGAPHAFELQSAGDHSLSPDTVLTFQGTAMTGPYTRDNVYWLTTAGGGTRVARRHAAPVPGLRVARSFTATLHMEQDTSYYVSMRASEGDDRWLWGNAIQPGQARRETFALRHPVHGPDARLRVRLHGYSSDSRVDPDHHVQFLVNDRPVGAARFDGLGSHVFEARVPMSWLVAGHNHLTIRNVGDTGALVDLVILNWFDLAYTAATAAWQERLDFQPPAAGRHAFVLTGFTSADVTVLDVTEPAAAVRLDSVAVTRAPDGTFSATFTDTAGPDTRYSAHGPAGAAFPRRVAPNTPSDWRHADNGADYIVITHPDFEDELAPLVEHRRAQGLRTAVVDVHDLYDEFSHGVFDPRAIRTFLRHADHHWRPPAPTYVLLVGAANLDYRDGYGTGRANFVPSMQVDVDTPGELGAVTSDLYFANLRGPDHAAGADVLLGRFPVSTPAQARTVVSKTLAYEAAAAADWQRAAVMVVDDNSNGSFESFSEELVALMGPLTLVRRFYAATYPRERNLPADISDAIHAGARVVNYIGHGNVDLWSPWPGGGRIYQNSDITQLRNGERLPIMTSATCMNGWIDHPLKPVSMAELWLTRPGGGGVAAWAPSGYTVISGQRPMFHAFYRELYGGQRRTLGELTAIAGREALAHNPGWADIVRMFVLVGDPALVVNEQAPATATATPEPRPSATVVPHPGRARLWLPVALRPG